MPKMLWKIRQSGQRVITGSQQALWSAPVFKYENYWPATRLLTGDGGQLWSTYERFGDWELMVEPLRGGGGAPTNSFYDVGISIDGVAALTTTGDLKYVGTVNSVQAGQVSAATAKLVFKDTTSSVQAAQVGAVVGKLVFSGSTASIQAGQVGTAVAQEVFTGATTSVQVGQVSNATGTTSAVTTGIVASVQAGQVGAAVAKEVFKGTVGSVQAGQVSAVAAQNIQALSITISAAAALSAIGILFNSGTVNSVQAVQVGHATGTVTGTGFIGQVTSVQAAQSSSLQGDVTAPTALPELITVAGARARHIAQIKLKVPAIKGRVQSRQSGQLTRGFGYSIALPKFMPGFIAGVAMGYQAEQVSVAQGTMVDTDLESVLQMAMQL